jgi:hypothetical protein
VFVGASDAQRLQDLGISPGEAYEAIQYKAGTYRSSGIDGIEDILSSLPLTLFVAPVLGLPVIRSLGDRVYRFVALRRRNCAIERA